MTEAFEETRKQNSYMIDPESGAEMARLLVQDRFITKGMGGIFPERRDLAGIHRILDLACGPGGWVLDVAAHYRDIEVIGVDISQAMIEYATVQAEVQGLSNAKFQIMDVTQPLAFPDACFDLINGRFLFGFMSASAWPLLVQDCFRVTRPGGTLRLTEFEFRACSSTALNELDMLVFNAMKATNRIGPDTVKGSGLTPLLSLYMRQSGYHHIQHMAHAIDFSAHSELHDSYFQDIQLLYKLLEPFLMRTLSVTSEEVEALYRRALLEIQREDFRALDYCLTVCGVKPL